MIITLTIIRTTNKGEIKQFNPDIYKCPDFEPLNPLVGYSCANCIRERVFKDDQIVCMELIKLDSS
jgi:hypothetical protein